MLHHPLLRLLILLTHLSQLCQSSQCQICIVDSTCDDDDDSVYFNISVSQECQTPSYEIFSFDTDVSSERHYLNVSIDCTDCFIDVSIDAVRDAWDYTLRLETSSSTDTRCSSTHVAHCGGGTSKLVWISAAALSGLFVIFGALVCGVKCYRHRGQEYIEKKKIEDAVIN